MTPYDMDPNNPRARGTLRRFRGPHSDFPLPVVAMLFAVAAIFMTAFGNEAQAAAQKPTISGTAMVGQTLTAVPDPNITDSSIRLHYQWVQVDAANDQNLYGIGGENNKTYVVADYTVGYKLRIRISYYREGQKLYTVESDATATVTNPPSVLSITYPYTVGTISHPENTTEVVTVTAYDPDGDAVTFSIPSGDAGGPDGSKFSINSSTGVLSFKAAPDHETATNPNALEYLNSISYNVIVRATSGTGSGQQTADRSIRIIVDDMDEVGPVFSTNAALSRPENQTTIGFVKAADADAVDYVKSYAISGGADQSKFSITTTGMLMFASAPDFETPTDTGANNTYVVTVRATSDLNPNLSGYNGETGSRVRTADQTITVTVTDVVEGAGGQGGPSLAPARVSSVNVTHNGTSLSVSWEAPARATHYDVTYSGNGTDARAAWNRAGTSLTITCDSRYPGQNRDCIEAGVTYTVGVRARNAAGESFWRNSAPASLQAPDAVASVTVTHKGDSLSVSWEAPARATHYDVTYSGNGTNARAAWNRAGTSLTIICDSRSEYQNQHCISNGATYTVGVRARNAAGQSSWVNSAPASYSEGQGKPVALELTGLPDGPQLRQNAPNPFNSQTEITWFQLRPGPARLEVFTLTGQRVAVLREGPQQAGFHRLRWDARDDQGRPLASGIYLYRLVTEQDVQTRKLTLLR